ncbi:MAG: response regulator [Acetobacteraceae bacterium]
MRQKKIQERPTILVVEDENAARSLVAEFLQDANYDVLQAEDADAAVGILNERPGIDLVFSDILMPGSMSGFGLARWILRHRPTTPVLLTSGFFSQAAVGEHMADIRVLQKPYSFDQLHQQIRTMLVS